MGANFLLSWYFAYLVAGGLAATINVVDHGAVGDGKTDDTKAFSTAWSAACGVAMSSTMLIPSGKTFLVGPVVFSGPCKSLIHLQVDGSIVAPNQVWKHSINEHWITILGINGGIIVDGMGQFDGNGEAWWTCRSNNICFDAPNALAFENCNNLRLTGLRFINSPMKHISIYGANGAHLSDLTITAPGDSPNTDGVHIQESKQVEILNSRIGTGDDCISIGTGSLNINISQINCGPGHGISIGSLGRDGSKGTAEQIRVSNCHFEKTTNGVRIKTWPGGFGLANEITFQSVNFSSVENPIVIDQFYCEHGRSCNTKGSAVQIQDVHYIGASGTTTSKFAISLNCSASAPCRGITMEDIDITSAGGPPPMSLCINAQGTKRETIIPPVPCLQ